MSNLSMNTVPATARLRSGTAARLAGVPVATLRVWERRYGVVAAPKTTTGQRQYSGHDVQRLRLIKQLSDRGHAIGTIAALPLDELEGLDAMAHLAPAPPRAAGTEAQRLVVIGRAVAHKLGAVPGCAVQAVHDDLDHAEAATPDDSGAPDVMLVHLASLQPDVVKRVLALGAHWQSPRLVVVYSFGAEVLADALRSGGATVRREPVGARELARLVSGATPASAALGAAAPRRFSDEALTRLATLPTQVACECPRHLCEMVLQLAAFERYSADCSAQTPADAALHQRLTALAGAARSAFEQALAQVIDDQGLAPRDGAPRS